MRYTGREMSNQERRKYRKLTSDSLNQLKKEEELPSNFSIEEIPFLYSVEHGDSTTVAFPIAKQTGKKPEEIAEVIAKAVNEKKPASVEKVEAVGGYINFSISRDYLLKQLSEIVQHEDYGKNQSLKGKNIMVEYAHPNTHKEMHIGHMRTMITGESLARLFEASGAKVFRANYQGDIGPHVAKAIWGTGKILQERDMQWEEAESLTLAEKAHLLGEGYVKGNEQYEANEDEIDALNVKLYERNTDVMDAYARTRKWSLGYYDELYKRFDTKFDKLYFESEMAEPGKKIVEENTGKVFEQSEGAVIFDGEKHGLHKRVFITKYGIPTYEGKEMALAPQQYKDFPFDLNVHVVANEQAGYFKVVFKALESIDKKFEGKEFHLSMGMVNLVGAKMSSRKGVVITVDGLLDEVKGLLQKLITNEELSDQERKDAEEIGTIAAVKYSVLKVDPKSNVMFDKEKSVSLGGNSGPYLQYTYARCKSILRREKAPKKSDYANLSKEETDLLRTAYQFEEVVEEATEKYSPSIVCNYVFDLAQKYNAFYSKHRVLEAETKEAKEFRLLLTAGTARLIQNSLHLLGIKTLEKM